ncbi:MAG: type II secretion system protein GspC [Candidatus Thiodiazotropha sp. (ex Semelilucina semeliformis)]|nr:type II secretion system protein GspC [Candidatus Thiodiazotropha sp. (ex Myrtea spinifera)]MCU7807794.1 type II secretion system protein GspC [Candidatus Thiodiazotropha sp. (ex Semelilucina semeliformis)]MCU7830725.1 type II secretion system protein GspC [Candidatus Thiodiazotropha sp. (ex Myrtea sp. 'scaly one' KF741663)]
MNIATQAQSVLNGLLDKNPPKWLESFISNTLPMVVTLLLVVIIGAKLAELTWRLIPVPDSELSSKQQIVRKPLPSGSRKDDEVQLEQTANLHLFGEAGMVKPVKQIEQKAPETRLNLTLHGVFVEENPEQGAAIIGTSGAKQKYYKVGANVMSGVKLQGVFDDRVVLLRNGQSEVLRFPKVSNRSANVASARPAASTRSSRAGAVNAASLSEYREVFQKEPLKIFEHVRFVPVRSRDGLKGYRVLPQKNRELYNKLGIRPSDLVTGVNGVTLTNDKEAMKLIQMLKDASSVQVDIVRNGQPQSLNFNLN